MKRFISFLAILLIVHYSMAQMVIFGDRADVKQDTVDISTVQIRYDFKGIKDPQKPDRYSEDLFILEIGKNKVSKFYSDNIRLRDSIFAQARKQAVGGNMSVNFQGKAANAEQSLIYKNYPKGKISVTDAVMNTHYLYEENLSELMQWQILPDTMTLLEYSCQKATTDFRGRRYEAWFTSEIPINEGPWKFCGLPGLILQVQDDQKQFIYQCNSISQSNDPILYPKKDYMKTSRKDFAKVQKKFTEDPMGYVKSSMPEGNVRIVVKNESGSVVENPKFPYNPIELN